jgi:Protein of unknown function (DUF2917)
MARRAHWNEVLSPVKAAAPGRHLLGRVYQRALSLATSARADRRCGGWELTTEPGVRTILVRRLPFSLRCIEGHVWITHGPDPGDHVLGPGRIFTASGCGLLILWAFEPSRLFVSGREAWQMSALRSSTLMP